MSDYFDGMLTGALGITGLYALRPGGMGWPFVGFCLAGVILRLVAHRARAGRKETP
jgi:hypothetical protein